MCLRLCINLLRAYYIHLRVLKLLSYIDYNIEHMPSLTCNHSYMYLCTYAMDCQEMKLAI